MIDCEQDQSLCAIGYDEISYRVLRPKNGLISQSMTYDEIDTSDTTLIVINL